MNRLFPRYPHAALALGLVAVLSACESPQPTAAQSPGGLPRVTQGERPRVTAATYLAYGELLERRGDVAQAAEQYRKAIAESPDLAAARNRLGVTLNKLAQHAEATEQFREALKLQPNDPSLLNNLAFSLYLEGEYAAANDVLTDLLDVRPTFRRARMNHGLVLARLGRDDEALTEFSFVTEPADAYYNLAVIQAECERYAAAATSLDQALQHNPQFAEARQQLRELARLAAGQQAQTPAVAVAGGATLVASTTSMDNGDAMPTSAPAPTASESNNTAAGSGILPMVEVRSGSPATAESAAPAPVATPQATPAESPAPNTDATPATATTQPAIVEEPDQEPSEDPASPATLEHAPAAQPIPMREVKPVPAAA